MPAYIIREVASNVSFIKREKLDKGVEYFRKAIDNTSEKFDIGVVIGELSSHLCHFGNKVTYE
ncbi:Tetratricopeptide repeat protein [Caenorhabditis elegans]|uniref:Tetratricopeptide repeat protein n=1 Tax=Caenorhabditis elegans TaxID=6239 RepID=Q95XF2_CAEEL|nr:Tetratricopeptide repeat protein [Caenorhabditis elegans]CCD74437.2 Tetratricopeptide repeat protein [Caenorhabditis elegans]|eukprot:NP_508070.2 F-box A protein [Caenorhabditis elegans]